jgi:hypothetical protein
MPARCRSVILRRPACTSGSIRSPRCGGAEPRHDLVSTNYLDVMSIPVRRGRGFSADDTESAQPVAVISQSTERTQFRGENAIGRHVQVARRDAGRTWAVIVGVVGDVHQYGLGRKADAAVYLPFAQYPAQRWASLVVRSTIPSERTSRPCVRRCARPAIRLGSRWNCGTRSRRSIRTCWCAASNRIPKSSAAATHQGGICASDTASTRQEIIAAGTTRSRSALGMESGSSDLFSGVRQVSRNLPMAAACIALLALGVGAAAAVFTVLYDAVLRPLPYPKPDQLVAVYNEFPKSPQARGGVSGRDFVDLAAHRELFNATAAYFFNDFTMTGTAYAQHVDAVNVSASPFSCSGSQPLWAARSPQTRNAPERTSRSSATACGGRSSVRT